MADTQEIRQKALDEADPDNPKGKAKKAVWVKNKQNREID